MRWSILTSTEIWPRLQLFDFDKGKDNGVATMKTTLLFLVCLLAQTFSLQVRAFDYVLSLEGSGTVDASLLPGETLNISLDTTDMEINIYGSMQIVFDPEVLEALYVDETSNFDSSGFFTAWTQAPGNPEVCGGGLPYYYFTGGGSDRADAYANEYGEGVVGPSAYIDNAIGVIRFYQFNYLEPGNYESLRIGFRLLQPGNTTLSIDSPADRIEFQWCDFDTTVSVEFTLGQSLPDDLNALALMLEQVIREDIQVSDAVRNSYIAHVAKLTGFLEKDLTIALLNQLQVLIFKVEQDLAQGSISLSDGQAILEIVHLMIELIGTA